MAIERGDEREQYKTTGGEDASLLASTRAGSKTLGARSKRGESSAESHQVALACSIRRPRLCCKPLEPMEVTC